MGNWLRLWLGRHGEAVGADVAGSDFSRILTEAGRRQVCQTIRWLLTREEAPELILHSPLIRAKQTAETIAAEISGGVILLEEPLLAPGLSTSALLRRLENAGVQRVVCIGHQPDIGSSLAEMIGGGRLQISPGTLAGLEFHGPAQLGSGTLRWLIEPSWFGS